MNFKESTQMGYAFGGSWNKHKQNSNASIVQEMIALGVISIWSEHFEK